MPLAAGTRLEGYEITALIGEGGMGQVYRARDTRLQRDVALKMLPDAFATDRERAARFDREAQALAALNHPHIAQIYDSGTVANPSDQSAAGVVFLVMELVAGEDLSARTGRGAMPLPEAVAIARQIALALEAAHAAGIVHRDLKPANVKVTVDNTVKVLDFGLAKATDPAGTSSSGSAATMTSPARFRQGVSGADTQQGLILGTAAYMAPEQARGRAVDKRADIWAFGCVLYEMLTGARPFDGDNVTDVIAAVVTKDPDWSRLPEDTPRSIRTLLKRCLQKEPRQRLHDIADARLELDAPMDETTGSGAGAGGGPTRLGRWPTWSLIAATALALAVGVAGGVAYQIAVAPPPPADWTATRLGGPAQSFRPRLSPDGHLLAFMSINDGLSQIYVMKPGTGAWTQLTRDRTHGLAFTLCWSTDGSHIYYDRITDAANGIYSVPALGGDERLVIENAQNPFSLPDGSLLFGRPNADRIVQLHRFWPASGKLEPLPVALAGDKMGPIRALEANRVVIQGGPLQKAGQRESIWIFDLVSQDLRPLAAALPPDIVSHAVDPRDRSVVLVAREGTSFRVLRVTTDGKGETTPLLTQLDRPDVDVAHDGSLYAGLESRPIEVLHFDESGANPQTISTDDTFQRGLAPLPDGRAMVVSRVGSGPRVVVITPGKDPVKLVETGEDTQNPMTAVGRDRAALLIGSGDAPEIAVVAVNTGRILKRFKTQGVPASLDASPDGTKLYVAAAGSISAIAVDTGDVRKIGAGDAVVVDPDTGELVVRFDEGTGYRLVRLPEKGGAPVPIALKGDLRMVFYPPSPGSIRRGRMVLPLAAADAWNWHVGVLNLATGELKRINVRPDLDYQYAAWTSDGRIVAYSAGTRAALWKFSR
jgi:hypothetical protein